MSNKETYFGLNKDHRYFLMTAGLLAGLAFFDFLASWHLIAWIGTALSPNYAGLLPQWQIFTIFIVGYLSRPVGAYLIGNYGDKYGRKPALQLNFLMLMVFTLMLALLPTHAMVGELAIAFLVIARIGQGLAFGSQFPILWTYATEYLPLQNIGLGTGIITASALGGGFIFFLILSLIENTLTQLQLLQYGWRLPFLISGILGMGLLYLTKPLEETLVFVANRPQLLSTPPMPFFYKRRWQKALPIATLSWFIASIVMVMIFLLPTLLEFSFASYGSLLYTGTQISLFFLVIGCVFFGFLTDRTNCAKILAIGSIACMLSLFGLFYDLATGGRMLLLSFTLAGFCAGVVGAMPAIMVRISKTQHRLSTVSFIYNSIFAVVGMILPLILGYATFYAKYSPVVYISFVCVVMLFLSFYLYYYPKNQDELYEF